jgi:ABC-type phosphate transport system substrate-binding protein
MALLLATLTPGASAHADLPVVAVIVHPSQTETPTLAQIKRIYLRQQRFWSDRTPVRPVNREYGSVTRRRFEARVLDSTVEALARHWNEQYFQGVLPPLTLASDAAVREYVAARPGAIGYVEARHVDDSVRVVARFD